MKTNCTWKEVYAIYDTLIPQEKLYLGSHFFDSPNTVFRWIVKRNGKNAGFIEMYDMKRTGSGKGELIVSIAIQEKYRGTGALQELQDAAEQFVSSNAKYNKLIWLAKDNNEKSIHCAKKLGYTKKYHELDHWVFSKTIKNKELLKSNNNDKELSIEDFNKQLNDGDYGILINGKAYTGENIDWSEYKTISPKDFAKYFVGTCWDYTEYEAKVFKDKFGFNFTLNALKHDREFSLYYMQINDGKKYPTHTWLAYRNNGKIYLFESSWKSQVGISEYNTEEEMVKDYIKKHRKENHDKGNPIIVTKYKPNKKFGLTPKEFMVRCIDQGKVIAF